MVKSKWRLKRKIVLFTNSRTNGSWMSILYCIIISNKVHIQRISFDVDFWKNELLPKLVHFYDNCLAPEIIHPMQVLGLPIQDISKE